MLFQKGADLLMMTREIKKEFPSSGKLCCTASVPYKHVVYVKFTELQFCMEDRKTFKGDPTHKTRSGAL